MLILIDQDMLSSVFGQPLYGDEPVESIWLKSYPAGMPAEISSSPYSTIPDMFEQSCQRFADKKAVTNLGVSLTYKQIDQLSKQFAAYLQQDLGLKKGDRFAIMMPNILQYYIAMFGALRAGLIVVNVNPLYTPRELSFQLKDSGAKSIIILANFAHVLEKVLPEHPMENIIITELGDLFPSPKRQLVNFVVKYVKKMIRPFTIPSSIAFCHAIKKGSALSLTPIILKGEDIAFLQYTGGTTGVAKGAMLSHDNLVANARQCIIWSDGKMRVGQEIVITPLPLYHIFSLTISCMAVMIIGGEVVLITNPRDIPNFVKEISKIPYTMMVGINTLYNALIHNDAFRKLDFKHLHLSISGGMATQAIVADAWNQLTGCYILEGYGLTEASPVLCINPFTLDKFTHSIGLPVPSTLVSIRNDNNVEVPLGEEGELCAKGPQVMKGYWNREDETKKTFTEDGWLRTGDIAKMDEHGYIFLVDRKKDMIVVSGFKVFPNEIEEVLAAHPGIKEAAAIGVPDESSTEAVKVFIVKDDPNLTEADVVNYCKENLTGYKRPKHIEFTNELPKSNVGKILRRKLREQEG